MYSHRSGASYTKITVLRMPDALSVTSMVKLREARVASTALLSVTGADARIGVANDNPAAPVVSATRTITEAREVTRPFNTWARIRARTVRGPVAGPRPQTGIRQPSRPRRSAGAIPGPKSSILWLGHPDPSVRIDPSGPYVMSLSVLGN